MTYQQRIQNHDDPLSVAIDADRENAELKANNARLRQNLEMATTLRFVVDETGFSIHGEGFVDIKQVLSDTTECLEETPAQSIAAIQYDVVTDHMGKLIDLIPDYDSVKYSAVINRIVENSRRLAESLIEGEEE